LPPRKSPTLTEAELRLMDVLWENGPGTVHQLLEALSGRPALAYNSVLTTIRILEKKGYVQHLKDGRAHVYQAVIGRKEATRSEVRNLVGRFFKNSHELLLLNLLEDRSLDAQELKRLRDLLQGDELPQQPAQEEGEKL
jgi:BlaI family transcriptional regulator, penicillinase repressor